MAEIPYRSRNALVLAKTETTPGQDANPTPAANAVLVEDPRVEHDLISVETNEVSGDLDVGASIPAGGRVQFACTALLRGRGTAGTAPAVSPLLRACSLAETITASAITGTAQAGGTNSIQLAAGASSVNEAYTGMAIRITAGAGSGQTRIIFSYDGSSKTAYVHPNWDTQPNNTSQYSIDANVMYRPGEQEAPCTIYHYLHHADAANSKLTKLTGCAGTVDFEASARNIPRLGFRLMSQLAAAADVTRPSAPMYDATQPPPFVGGSVYLGAQRIAAARIGVGIGADAQMPDDPNEAYGFDRPRLVQRRIQVTIAVPVQTETQLNLLSSWSAGTTYRVTAMWGSTAGNRFALVVPNMRFHDWRITDRDGLAYYEATARPTIEAAVPFALTYW